MKFHWLYQRDAWRLCAVDLGGWVCTVAWSTHGAEWVVTIRLRDGTSRTVYRRGALEDAKASAVTHARAMGALDPADELVEVPS